MKTSSARPLSVVKNQNDALNGALNFVYQLFKDKLPEQMEFHTFAYVEEVVRDCEKISKKSELEDDLTEKIAIAACFVFSGYASHAQEGWSLEEASCRNVEEFLSAYDWPQEWILEITSMVKFGCDPIDRLEPQNMAQEILGDALLAFLGKKKFWKRTDALRKEMSWLSGKTYNDVEWNRYLGNLAASVAYRTEYASQEFADSKARHLQKIHDGIQEIIEPKETLVSKNDEISRATETLLRTQYRSVMSLIGIADKKAGMMIHMNAIVFSIGVSYVLGRYHEHPSKIALIPTIVLIFTSLLSIWLAVLAVRPNIVKNALVTREQILNRKGNLMTQMIFSDISFDDFKFGMHRMAQNDDAIYESMLETLHANGQLLKVKFQRIRASYQVFIYGISITVLAFVALVAWGHLPS